ncbi:hypothetical protein IWX92DRAFT_374499 [Phyllosticta citricarpa]
MRAQIFHPTSTIFCAVIIIVIVNNVIGHSLPAPYFIHLPGPLNSCFQSLLLIFCYFSDCPFLHQRKPFVAFIHPASAYTNVWICTLVPCWQRIRRHALASTWPACRPTDVSEDFVNHIFRVLESSPVSFRPQVHCRPMIVAFRDRMRPCTNQAPRGTRR